MSHHAGANNIDARTVAYRALIESLQDPQAQLDGAVSQKPGAEHSVCSTLTAAQKRKIAENRAVALKKRRISQLSSSSSQLSSSSSPLLQLSQPQAAAAAAAATGTVAAATDADAAAPMVVDAMLGNISVYRVYDCSEQVRLL